MSKVNKDMTELKKQNEEYLNSLKRTQADFINFKKRTEDEKRDWLKFANVGLLVKITPIIDNFRRAKEHMPEELLNNDFVRGLMAMEKQFEAVLADEGVEKISTEGQFDPKWHEVVESVVSDLPEGSILTTLATGYRLGERVLAPAKVRVSGGLAQSENNHKEDKEGEN